MLSPLSPHLLNELSKEYINRRIAEAENERLVQLIQAGKQPRNPFGVLVNSLRRIIGSRSQATTRVTDTQTVQTVS